MNKVTEQADKGKYVPHNGIVGVPWSRTESNHVKCQEHAQHHIAKNEVEQRSNIKYEHTRIKQLSYLVLEHVYMYPVVQ